MSAETLVENQITDGNSPTNSSTPRPSLKIYPQEILLNVRTSLGVLSSFMHFGWTSPYLPLLESGNYSFTVTREESSWITVALPLGEMIGLIICFSSGDKFGRKLMLHISAVPYILSWLMVGSANSALEIIFARLLAGLADGFTFVTVPHYVAEISSADIRGGLLHISPVSQALGILLVATLGSLVSLPITAYISATVPLILLLTFHWMPESPYHSIAVGNAPKAMEDLRILKGTEDVEEDMERISRAVLEASLKEKTIHNLLMVKTNRKAIILMLVLKMIQYSSGFVVVTFYCQKIFEETTEIITPSYGVVLYASVALVVSIVSSLVVDKSGKRILLTVSCFGAGIFQLISAICFYLEHFTNLNVHYVQYIIILSLLGFITLYGFGLQTVPFAIVGEIFPTDVKVIASCFISTTYLVAAVVNSLLYEWSENSFGIYFPFAVFAFICFMGGIFVLIFVPETKGKTLEEIQIELRGFSK